MKKLIFSIIVLSHITIHGRDTNDGYLARAFSWVKQEFQQLARDASFGRTHLPKGKLEYKAAQLNDTIRPQLTEAQRTIVLEVVEQFKMLASHGAQGFEEPQELLASLLTAKGRTRYTQEFALDEHKSFLESETGQKTLASLLAHTPPKLNKIRYPQRTATGEHWAKEILAHLTPLQEYLKQLDEYLKAQQQNPKIRKALETLEQNPALVNYQERVTELDQLLEQQQQDPQVVKLLPLLQQKDQELQMQLLRYAQTPGVTEQDIEQKVEEGTTEMEAFVTQYPPLQKFTDTFKERVELEQAHQERIQKIHADSPELHTFIEQAQAQAEASETHDAYLIQLQSLPQKIAHAAEKRNTQIWCEQVRSWFAACRKALKDNSHHDEHVLHYEDEVKRQRDEFYDLTSTWKKLLEPIDIQREIQETYQKADDYDQDIAQIQKSPKTAKEHIALSILHRFKLPLDVWDDCKTLGITDTKQVNAITCRRYPKEAKKLIRQAFHRSIESGTADFAQKQAARTRLMRLVNLDEQEYYGYQEMLNHHDNPAWWQKMRQSTVRYLQVLGKDIPSYLRGLEEVQERHEQAITEEHNRFHTLFPKSKKIIAQQLGSQAIEYIGEQQEAILANERRLDAIENQIALLRHRQQAFKTDVLTTKEKLKDKITKELALPLNVARDCNVVGIKDPAIIRKIMNREITNKEIENHLHIEPSPSALSTHTEGHLIYSNASHLQAPDEAEEKDASLLRLVNYLRMPPELEETYYDQLATYYNPAERAITIDKEIADLQQQKQELLSQASYIEQEQQRQLRALEGNTFIKKHYPAYTQQLHDALQANVAKEIEKVEEEINKTDILKAHDCAVVDIAPRQLFDNESEQLLYALKQKYRKTSRKYHPDMIQRKGGSQEEIEKAKKQFEKVDGAYKRVTEFLQLDPQVNHEKITRVKQLLALKKQLQKQSIQRSVMYFSQTRPPHYLSHQPNHLNVSDHM